MKTKSRPRGPLLGAHMSIAGGVGNAFLEGQKVACEAIQIFTKSSRQWASKPLSKDEIAQFHSNRKETGIRAVVAHDSYLLNLGSPDPALRKRSVGAFIDEMERCEVLGVSNLIAHPGAHVGAGELEGIKTIAKSLDEIHQACPGFAVKVTLEITAGQGSNLGYRFEQIGDMMDATKRTNGCASVSTPNTPSPPVTTFAPKKLRADVCRVRPNHRHRAAGGASFERFEKGFDSRVDRHEHIGRGFIGVEAFRLLVNDRRFWGLPMCLETPKGPDLKEDRENLTLLRSLIEG